MDDLDQELLSALRHNARTPVSSLAVMTGASRATVAARIDRLVANGTISAFTIRTGHETRAAGLRGLPQVRALHSTNGKWDFIAELEDRDLVSFDETLRRIRLIDGINTTETNILLKTRKASF
jgi:DNA-binding Lrp family transcriptional regulator